MGRVQGDPPRRPATEDDPATEVIEFSTQVRGRRVSCTWDGERLTGDLELLDRLRRAGAVPRAGTRPGLIARAIRAAVPAPVRIEVRGPSSGTSRPVTREGTFSPAPGDDSLPTMAG